MTEFTKDNSYPCPSCGEPKLKDEWEWCDACRASKPEPATKLCSNCMALRAGAMARGDDSQTVNRLYEQAKNSGYRRRCWACGQKLRPKGIVRDLTATQTSGPGGASFSPEGEMLVSADSHSPKIRPLISEMLEYLPESGSMEIDERLCWLQLLETNLSMAYGEHGEQARIEMRLVWKRRSFWSRLLGRKA